MLLSILTTNFHHFASSTDEEDQSLLAPEEEANALSPRKMKSYYRTEDS
jgi:hypothetical protein